MEIEKEGQETRRLQKIKKSYFVSLPVDWVSQQGLTRGSPLDIVTYDIDTGFVSVEPTTDRGPRVACVSLHSEEIMNLSSRDDSVSDRAVRACLRTIVGAYVVGYDVITIKSKVKDQVLPPKLRDTVTNFIEEDKLLNVDLRSTATELRLTVGPAGPTFRQALERMYDNINSMHIQAMSLLERFDRETARSIEKNDITVDALFRFTVRTAKMCCQSPRLLVLLGLYNTRFVMGLRIVSKRLELCGDCIRNISRALSQLNEKGGSLQKEVSHRIKELSGEAISIVEEMVDALFATGKGSFDKANETIEKALQLIEREKQIFLALPKARTPEEDYAQKFILEVVRRIAEYSITCCEIILNLNVESVVTSQPR